ncbi:tetraacyldisaccharide 4'-kinase [Thorsellia anophelis]|uniref:Tetraacyldisaccharide 4'-kinase n=1 Tax=Thorsellia anophelis DSM 18579 TaxID=1123402 RepID=A0A1I0DGV4_9GAMM|nr:tetraacyldisaccharide 4'-kinase [Thorsellia anophelis]SET31663.1 lipid-A-disaccharide kinase [Thorsellia anophelis DSM 18579]
MQKLAHYIWFENRYLFWLLWPLSLVYGFVVLIRRCFYRIGIFKTYRSPVPIIVIGNLTVGGNGKTPTVIWLLEQLQQKGIEVGVITRGYGSKAPSYPLLVTETNNAIETGDEPFLIYRRTKAAIAISPNRKEAIELLLNTHPNIQLIISDDGLQHYAFERDIEWVVIDAYKQFGNGWWLPAGPMRERANRLKQVDALLFNYGTSKNDLKPYHDVQRINSVEIKHLSNPIMCAALYLSPLNAVNLVTNEQIPITHFTEVIAIAGIGFPDRFFDLLKHYRVDLHKCVPFPDHHQFKETDLTYHQIKSNSLPILMTEKDAMKCLDFAHDSWWYVPINAIITQETTEALLSQVCSQIHK